MKTFLTALAAFAVAGAALATRVQSCPTAVQLQMAPTGCRLGTAIAAVDAIDGATYAWTVQGGTLVSGAGTERIVVALGSGQTVKVSVLVNSPSCGAMNGSALMALQDPFALQGITVSGGTHAGQARTLTWSYRNGEPVSQILTGSDFPQPVVLAAPTRSYTYTPSLYGDKSVVLDAATVPPPARAHAAGRGGAPASSCTSAHAEAKFHVDCNTPDAAVSAPAATGVGLPFTASVKLPAGTKASWTITNASPASASGASVSITPLGNAPVGIHVTVTADTCSADGSAEVKVDSSLGCAVVPQATLSLASADCDKAVIGVRLAGTPPFAGTWSDGEPFLATSLTAERTVTTAADYTIKNFRDAFCPGTATALKVAIKPTATLSTSGNSCIVAGDSTAVITFTGTPPFLGEWSDSVAFNTSATRLERKITKPGDYGLKWFQDGQCDGVVAGQASFGTPGTANVRLVSPENGCLTLGFGSGAPASIAVDLTGTPPFTLQWSDGNAQTANASPATRSFVPNIGTIGTVTLTAARDAYCDLSIGNGKVTVATTAAPQIGPADQSPLCPDRPATVSLKSPVAIGSKITWRIDNGGAIVSGQGTPNVSFTVPSGQALANLTVEVADPATCTATATARETVAALAGPVDLKASATTINFGQSVTFTTTVDLNRNNFTAMQVTAPYFEQFGGCWHEATCSYTYTPTSPGTYTFTAASSSWCPYLPGVYATVQVTVK